MPNYILAHDIGTTNHKCTVFNEAGEIVTSASRTYTTYYRHGGVAEQNPNDWWKNFLETTAEVLKEVNHKKISGISFSAHMNGCLPVDHMGNPLMYSMIHADSRSSEIEKEVYEKILEEDLYKITGNRMDSRYTLLKMYWLRQKNPEIYQKAKYFLQAKDYLAFKLTGNLGVTDYSDASLTGALNLHTRQWEEGIFKELGLEVSKMPIPMPSTEIIGYVQQRVAAETGLMEGTPVVIGGGDGASATVGAGCVKKEDTYISLGTTAWVSKVVGQPFIDPEKRVFTICDLNPNYYNVLGTMQTAGASYEWAVKQLSSIVDWEEMIVIPQYRQFEDQIKKVPAGARGVLFHPYLIGERSPIWNDKARGSFFGIGLEHNRFDLARAVLEGIAYSLESIEEIINPTGSVDEIRMIGGLAKSESLIQIISDVLNLPVQITHNSSETTSMGAAIACGVGIGMFSSFEEAGAIVKGGRRYMPEEKNSNIYNKQLKKFKLLYNQIKDITFP